jgi:hypothetical protein
VSDPSPLSTVESTMLSEGIKFLFGQAAELLRRWRRRRDQPAGTDAADDTADADAHMTLDELARDCARDGRYAFLLASVPLNLRGGVGSPPQAVAIK